MSKPKKPKIHRYQLTKAKFLNDDEYSELETKLASLAALEPRDTLLIYLAMYAGGRAQEILNIRPIDLDHKNQSVFITGLKGSNDRDIPLPAWLFGRLAAYSADTPPKSRIFTISYQRLRQIWHFFRPVKKTFHSLRHTFAVRLYARTKDIKLVQLALGHRHFSNTLIYLQFSYSNQEMRRLLVVEPEIALAV